MTTLERIPTSEFTVKINTDICEECGENAPYSLYFDDEEIVTAGLYVVCGDHLDEYIERLEDDGLLDTVVIEKTITS
jgi:hypothetical protein